MAELELVRGIVAEFASLGITEISRTVCELLQWKRPNGGLKNIECRQMLERLQEQGLVNLPALRRTKPRGPQPVKLTAHSGPEPELGGSAGQYEPLRLELLGGESRGENPPFGQWAGSYHALGRPVPFPAPVPALGRA